MRATAAHDLNLDRRWSLYSLSGRTAYLMSYCQIHVPKGPNGALKTTEIARGFTFTEGVSEEQRRAFAEKINLGLTARTLGTVLTYEDENTRTLDFCIVQDEEFFLQHLPALGFENDTVFSRLDGTEVRGKSFSETGE